MWNDVKYGFYYEINASKLYDIDQSRFISESLAKNYRYSLFKIYQLLIKDK